MEYNDLVAVTEINKCRDSDGKEESEVEKSWSPTICFFSQKRKVPQVTKRQLRKTKKQLRKTNADTT